MTAIVAPKLDPSVAARPLLTNALSIYNANKYVVPLLCGYIVGFRRLNLYT